VRSTSQTVLRMGIGVVSVALALLTVAVGPLGSVVAALVLVGLTPFVVLDPGSRLTALLVGLHGLHWLMSHRAPDDLGDWLLTLVFAVGLLTLHLGTALAAALPASAPVPRASASRWAGRSLAVVGLCLPVWALLATQTVARPDGDTLATYSALAALTVLGLALWISLVRPRPRREG